MIAENLYLTIMTRTPIWTGGIDGKADRLHITGIIGSLRWWFEAMVRGVGGHVCGENKPCIYDPEQKPYQGLCDVCRVFGATGWARRFKLVVDNEQLEHRIPTASSPGSSGKRVFSLSNDHPASRDPKWYLNGNPLSGSFSIRIVSTGLIKDGKSTYFDLTLIGSLLQFIADRASLGAKPQMGLGVITLSERQSTLPLLRYLREVVATHKKNSDARSDDYYDALPSLQNLFFAKVEVDKTPITESDTFDLKYNLRGDFRKKYPGDDQLRHMLMGDVPTNNRSGNNRIGSKIMMSYPYIDNGSPTIRLWGWVPRSPNSQPSRSEILNEISFFLEDTYGEENVSSWHYFVPENHEGILEYLETQLLKEPK